jgi:hypothetical protein
MVSIGEPERTCKESGWGKRELDAGSGDLVESTGCVSLIVGRPGDSSSSGETTKVGLTVSIG